MISAGVITKDGGTDLVGIKEKSSILVFLLLFAIPQLSLFQVNYFGRTFESISTSDSYLGEVITITSDAEFAAVASSMSFPGNGSLGNPYVIADLDIDYIHIYGTTVYFEIRRCYFAPTSDPRSIDFDTVENGLVDSCVIEDRPNGIKVAASTGIIISNNTLRSLIVESISVDFSFYSDIINNSIISDGQSTAIGCYKSYYLTIDSNTITDCRDGLYLPFSEYLNITNNHVTNCGYGLFSSGGFDIHVANNTFVNTAVFLNSFDSTMTFTNNTVNGLALGVFSSLSDEVLDASQFGQLILWLSNNVTIVNGTFNQLSHCIELMSCWDCTIENVTFANSAHGIWMTSSTACEIRNVTFRENYGWPLYAEKSHNLLLINSTIESDGDPILLFETLNCTIIGNRFINSYISFKRGVERYSYGSNSIEYFVHHIEDNTVDDLLLGYFLNETGVVADLEEYGQMVIVNCTDFDLGPSTILDRVVQIQVFHSRDISLVDCDIQSNGTSMVMFIQSPHCNITDCDVEFTSFLIHESSDIIFSKNTMSSESGNFILGLRMESCANSTIEENALSGPYIEGLLVMASPNATVKSNELVNVYFGLVLEGDNSLVKSNNVIASESNGLSVLRSSNCTIEDNDCRYNSASGLVVDECINTTISKNIAITNDVGLRLSESTRCLVDSNRFEQNHDYGGYMTYSTFCTIVNNSVRFNWDVGLRAQHSSNNSFYLNRLGWNDARNALDDGFNNTWDNGVDTGNLWNDYSGIGVYNIPGTAQSVDRFPGVLLAEDGSPPTLSSPTDIIYEFGTSGNMIYWQATDQYPHTYQLERNGTVIESGPWESEIFAINIDGLEIGVYNFTLTVCDEGGLCRSDTVFVSVVRQLPQHDDLPYLLVLVGGGIFISIIIVIILIRIRKRPIPT